LQIGVEIRVQIENIDSQIFDGSF